MKLLNIITVIISIISMFSFLYITFIRITTIRKHAKKFGAKKEITDPLLYWFSYISAFSIIIIKLFCWIKWGRQMTATELAFKEILPTIALVIFTRTIGKSVILRAEKNIYVSNLLSEVKDVHKLVKEENKWTLFTSTGQYPITLNNTSVYKIADVTGATIEDE